MKQEVEEFIRANQHKATAAVALLLSKKTDYPREYILNRINGLQKAERKLPFLLKHPKFEFPNSKAVEQSSSEITAKYKGELLSGKCAIDLSGGMGMDSYFLAQNFEAVHYVERNETLFKLTDSNFKNALDAHNVQAHQTDALNFLQQFKEGADLIYLDPDRRSAKDRAFLIEDCEPNVAELLPLIFEKSKNCLIKLSPMLDIWQAMEQLEACREVQVVSVKNECKELLFLLEKGFQGETTVVAKELAEKSVFAFTYKRSEERALLVNYNAPQDYLYDPGTAIRKAGAFKTIADQFQLEKLATNTHLYTANVLRTDFPGRVLKVKEVFPPQKGKVKRANVVARNFPLEVKEIKRKYKINDGGDAFLYACSLQNGEKIFVLAEKINS